jgi:hypothetical protein
MNEVSAMWSSAWRNLQKNLAGGIGADGAATSPMFEVPVHGSALRSCSWLIRAYSRRGQQSRKVQ